MKHARIRTCDPAIPVSALTNWATERQLSSSNRKWRSSQLIAPVCAGLTFWAHCWRIIFIVSCSVFSPCLSAILVFVVHVHMYPPTCVYNLNLSDKDCWDACEKYLTEWQSLLPNDKVCCRMTKSIAEWQSLYQNAINLIANFICRMISFQTIQISEYWHWKCTIYLNYIIAIIISIYTVLLYNVYSKVIVYF